MFSFPSTETEILQVEYRNQFVNLGHNEKILSLVSNVSKGPKIQATEPAMMADDIYPM